MLRLFDFTDTTVTVNEFVSFLLRGISITIIANHTDYMFLMCCLELSWQDYACELLSLTCLELI